MQRESGFLNDTFTQTQASFKYCLHYYYYLL